MAYLEVGKISKIFSKIMSFDHWLGPWFINHAFWSQIMIFQKFSKFSLLPDRPILAYLMDITHAFWSKIMIFQKAWAIAIK